MRTILLAALACSSCLAQSAPSLTIVNSGSTNFPGYRIVVDASGKAEYTMRPRRRPVDGSEPKTVVIDKTIPQPLVNALFADVAVARPLTSLPARHCMKSVSFGTHLTLQVGDEVSPDLSCGDGGNEKLHVLIQDINQVVKIFRGE